MLTKMRTLPGSTWLMAMTMAFFGWLEAFIVETLRITPGPLGQAADTGLLAGIAAMLAVAGLALKFSLGEKTHRVVSLGAFPWALILSLIGWQLASPLAWALLETAALLPIAILWLSHLPASLAERNRSFLLAWLGATLIAGLLILLVHFAPVSGRSVFALSLIVISAAVIVVPAPPKTKPSLRPIRPNQTGGAALALFVALGLGGSAAAHWATGTGRMSWTVALLLTVASLLVLLAVPFALKRTRHLVAYLSAVFLALDLLGFADPGTRSVFLGLQFLLLVAANLLCLWWAISLVSALRRAPVEMGLALAGTTLAVAIGWFLPAVTGQSVIWMLVAVLLVVIATPFLMGHARAPQPTTTGFRGNPEHLFERAKLTPQERRIVQLLLQGKSNQAIIQELYVSINTLKTHLKNIYRKTETKNRHELIDLIGAQRHQSAGQ